MQVAAIKPRRKHNLPKEAKNKVYPNAPVPGSPNELSSKVGDEGMKQVAYS
jgi:hypothetical protein